MTTPTLPKDIEEILDRVLTEAPDNERVKGYIGTLQTIIQELGGSLPMDDTGDDEEDSPMPAATAEDDGFVVPQYESGEDYEAQSDLKMKATDAKNEGKLEDALELYNQAVQAAPPSALLYANRAMVLEKLEHYKAAEVDLEKALAQNPDSAKALKVRGKLRFQHLQDWEGALKDLSQAQAIDYDPDIAAVLEELTKKRVEKEKQEAQERIEKEEKLKKKAEDIKKAQEEARREAEEQARSSASGGMPGSMPGGMGGMPGGMGGMPGGMGGMPGMGGGGGMPGMADLMNDPELLQAMQNPKVMAAFQELMSSPGGPMGLMSNPQKLQELMADPEVGPILQKLMSKFGGGAMGGGAGMPGGMGGMGGGGSGGDDDDIPDMDDLPDLD